eukprot:XP_001703053.1 predicted protein [Chlamydomonas reinhardtii]
MARPVELSRSRGTGLGPREGRRLTFGISTQSQSSRATLLACPVAAPQRSGPSSATELSVPHPHEAQAQAQAQHAAAAQRQLARQRDLVEALVGRRDDAELASVNRSGVTAVNAVLGVLADMGHVHALQRLLRLAVGLGAYNEHTYASAFRGLYRAGRLGMALAAFEEACRSGRDLGPVACSALLHREEAEPEAAADESVGAAFSGSQGGHSSHNGAAYRSHAPELTLDCSPDAYTYSALPELAMRFFDAGIAELGLLPTTPIYNAALAAMARAGRPLPELMSLYREMVFGRPV